MKKFLKQIFFNLIIFFASILAMWFAGSIKALDCIPLKDCLTADFLFLLITTLAGLQGSRWIEGYIGWKPLNWVSGAIQIVFLVVYGVAIPLQGELFVTNMITFCLWLFALGILIEYGITFWYTLKTTKNPNSIASGDRYKNDEH